jgi:hypothetical protein
MGRWPKGVVVIALLTAACSGPPAEPAAEAEAWDAYCLVFFDTTEYLSAWGPDLPSYQRELATVLRPLLGKVYGEDPLPIDDPALNEALERLGGGAGTPDDLWAVDALGELLVEEGAGGCAGLGRNLTAMPVPPSHGWDVPPETHIDSDYPAGSAEAACDVFILTVISWIDDIAAGAELGPSLAQEADTLRVALAALGVEAGAEQLRLVAEKWEAVGWGAAAEEAYAPLQQAGALLAPAAPRCGDLVQVLVYHPEPPATTTTVGDPGVYWDFDCRSAPVEQRTSASSMWLAVDPHPVTAGASVALEVGTREGRREDYTGSWVGWECWNGSGWVMTHIMELGWESGGRVVPGEPGVTWTVAGVDYRTPNEFWFTVPNVPPGWYRLRVDVFGGGYLVVEVVEAG